MGLFSFGKKKKEDSMRDLDKMPEPPKPPISKQAQQVRQMPLPPMPPAPMHSRQEHHEETRLELPKLEIPKIGLRHSDDLDHTPINREEKTEGPLFPEIPKLDLTEIEAGEEEKEIPELFPAKEISLPKLTLPAKKFEEHKFELPELEVPDELPEIGETKLDKLDRKIPRELPELEMSNYVSVRKKKNPLFINVDSYSAMIEQLNVTKAKLNEYGSAATRVLEVRTKKAEDMEKWRNLLEDIERKLLQVDNIMFEGGG